MSAVHRAAALGIAGLVLAALDAGAQSLEGVLMPGKVIEGHAKLEAECRNCHVLLNKAAQDQLCLDCHKDVAKDVTAKGGYHGRIDIDSCRGCHTEHKGRDANIAPLDEKRFDHALTDYPLKGKHAQVQCRACHKPGAKARAAPGACADCHRKDDVHKGSLGPACADCHTERSWKDTTFDHAKTRFPLDGKHASVKCKDCHRDTNFKQTPQACVACHRKDDRHKGRYGEKCETCHSAKDWTTILFNHDVDTAWALRGKHRDVKCATCHTGVLYREKLQTQCIACHRKDDTHRGALGSACGDCHVERSWKETRFDHGKTRFPLLGKHASVECKACHKNANYKDAPMTCVACHRKDDKHKGTLGEACGTCHTEKNWKEARFDHSKTRFPLRGKHTDVKCADCHREANPKNTPSACIACHRKDDRHKGILGEKCETCHVEQSWKTIRFDHDRDTRYPLRGKHRSATCQSCHTQPAYKVKLASTCIACHTRDDVHKGQQGERCEQCHQEADWKKTSFDHGRSRFPLVGRHLGVPCAKCHATARYKDVKSTCVACHDKQDVHKRRLGTQCESCHNARDWKIWDFDHGRKTRFDLDGGHARIECYACHKLPVEGKPTLPSICASCHAGDDVHDGAFGRQCEKCHVTSSFRTVKQRVQGPGGARSHAAFDRLAGWLHLAPLAEEGPR